ncbi:nucleoside 2-deoxyribosyltransferase [Pseudomonas sp. TE3610]
MTPCKPVYLAGFDVFRRDAVAYGQYLKSLCAEQGLQGVYPFDNQLPAGLEGLAAARWICEQNIAMIRRCDGVLANLNMFRGQEPDSGTAFEVGLAVALGKPVWAYFALDRSLREQVPHDPQGYDAQGFAVEDFNLPRNLMLAASWAGYSATVEQAVGDLRRHLASTS